MSIRFNARLSFLLLVSAAAFASDHRSDREAAAPVRDERVIIFGLDRFGGLLSLPRAMCVYPGQSLALAAEGIDDFNRRMYIPRARFSWRMTVTQGPYEIWNANGPESSTFRRGYEA